MQTLTDKTDALTLACEKLRALAWLFSENYTSARLDKVPQTISANPGAFVSTFSIIEDLIEDVQVTAQEVADMAYKAARKSLTARASWEEGNRGVNPWFFCGQNPDKSGTKRQRNAR